MQALAKSVDKFKETDANNNNSKKEQNARVNLPLIEWRNLQQEFASALEINDKPERSTDIHVYWWCQTREINVWNIAEVTTLGQRHVHR